MLRQIRIRYPYNTTILFTRTVSGITHNEI
jgi:hypothetical protein